MPVPLYLSAAVNPDTWDVFPRSESGIFGLILNPAYRREAFLKGLVVWVNGYTNQIDKIQKRQFIIKLSTKIG
jgi:hypothetical protein